MLGDPKPESMVTDMGELGVNDENIRLIANAKGAVREYSTVSEYIFECQLQCGT